MERITNRDFAFGAATIINGSVLLAVYAFTITVHETWIVAIAVTIATLVMGLVYASLIKQFPGQTLTEMCTSAFGKTVGSALTILYLLFIVFLISLSAHDLGKFFIEYVMSETPLWIILLMFLVTCAYAVSKGIYNILKICVFFIFISLISVILNTLLCINVMDLSNLKPLFSKSPQDYLSATGILSIVPFCESAFILMVAPLLPDPSKSRKPIFTGILIGGFILLVITLRDILVLGDLVSVLSLPSFESVRMINVLEVFTRLEILFSLIVVVEHYAKISLLYCITVDEFCNFFKTKKTGIIIAITGLIVYILGLTVFVQEDEIMRFCTGIGLAIFAFFEIFIPLILLITAALKKRNNLPSAQNQECSS